MYTREWADGYGASWYKHYDGTPPHDDDSDYYWNGFQWVKEDYELEVRATANQTGGGDA